MIEIFASADTDAKGTYVIPKKYSHLGNPKIFKQRTMSRYVDGAHTNQKFKHFRDKHSFLMRQNKIPRLCRSSDNIKAP